jgi:hypothetical protein
MRVSGDLDTMDLEDVLGWLRRRQLGGRLRLRQRSTEKRLGLCDGRLATASSNDPRESLAHALVRDQLVAEEPLIAVLVRQARASHGLGALLVADGLLDASALRRSLERNAEELVYDAFLWRDGQFEFEAGALDDSLDRCDLALEPVIQEARHRREQWQHLLAAIPSSETRFKVRDPGASLADPSDRQLVALAGTGRTLAGISLEARRPRFETSLRLHALVERGTLEALAPHDQTPESDPVGAIRALLEQAEVHRGENRHDAAATLYDQVLSLDRLNQQARVGLLDLADERRQWQRARRLPLEAIPLLKLGAVALTREQFDHHEGFVLSRVNGQWSVGAILKLCPMPEHEALAIFDRLLERGVIEWAQAPDSAR